MTTTEPIIGLSITAAPIIATGMTGTDGRHQLRLGSLNFIHIAPEVAQQWITVLKPIAEGK